MTPTVLRKGLAAAGGSARSTLGRGLSWWVEEMLDLLPPRIKDRIQRPERQLWVDVEGARVSFTLRDAQGMRSLGEFPAWPDSDAVPPEIDVVKQALGGRGRDIVLRISPARVLRRVVSLPAAAARDLSAVLGFELDRYTPFKAEQAYYGFAIQSRDRARGELQVALTVVARKEIDPLLEKLRSWGLAPTSLGLRDGDDPGPNLLPAASKATPPAFPVWRNRALAALATALLVAVVALPLMQKMETEARLEQEVASARDAALQAEQIRKELKQFTDEEDAIVERRRQRPPSIQLLDEVTRLLPDSAWLNRFELSDSRMTLRGEAANASELIKLIESSGRFRSAAFEGALTRDARSERERFTISATAVQGSKP